MSTRRVSFNTPRTSEPRKCSKRVIHPGFKSQDETRKSERTERPGSGQLKAIWSPLFSGIVAKFSHYPGFGTGAVCAKTTPPFVIPRPALLARNLLAASSETADSSRDHATLRNDNPLGIFKVPPPRT